MLQAVLRDFLWMDCGLFREHTTLRKKHYSKFKERLLVYYVVG